ncbi:MAG: NTP transferase domain-containing protein [Mogibacterium sp.]|nr:NTP transferase domain-containing protein [Mogibacterium sp.]
MNRNTGCALLAGGAGSRMGNINKAELKYQGMTFAEKAASELTATGMPCYLSVANYEQTVPEGWKLVRDRVRGDDGSYIGPMGGIFSCLTEAAKDGLDGLFFTPCDAPEFTGKTIAALETYIEDHDAVLWRTGDGNIQTAFGYYSVRCIPQFRNDIREGKYKLIKSLECLDTAIISTADAGVDDKSFRNINHMYEYRVLNGTVATGKRLTAIDEAVSALVSQDVQLSTEHVPLLQADGRVLAEDIRAARPMPPFRRSCFDGYVMKYEDIQDASHENPVTLRVLETVTAGEIPSGDLPEGTAMRIMTGALCPDNGTCVVKYEETEFTDDSVTVFKPMRKEQNVIPVGEEYDEGELLIQADTRLDPAMVGVIATQGTSKVKVYRRPTAAIISTGSELQEIGSELRKGNIYGSSCYTLAGYLEQDGLEVRSTEIVSDDPVILKDKITALLDQIDILFTTGGASNGDKDHASLVMEELGFRMLFRKVDMKPGACMLAGVKDGKILVCLSGSPGAALTSYLRVAQPLVRKMSGRRNIYPKTLELRLENEVAKPTPHTRVLKGNIVVGEDGLAYFRENPRQLNGMIYGFANMGVIADIPVNDGPTPAGTIVTCRMLER